eukprot:gene26457-47779_t
MEYVMAGENELEEDNNNEVNVVINNEADVVDTNVPDELNQFIRRINDMVTDTEAPVPDRGAALYDLIHSLPKTNAKTGRGHARNNLLKLLNGYQLIPPSFIGKKQSDITSSINDGLFRAAIIALCADSTRFVSVKNAILTPFNEVVAKDAATRKG